MASREDTLTGGILEDLTLPELVELWVETEINRRLDEVERFHAAIIGGARGLDGLQVMPLRGGFYEHASSIEVLVEVRDRVQRHSCIGAWRERKRGSDDAEAFQRAYEKALAHAIIQLLPAAVWRPWTRAAASSA